MAEETKECFDFGNVRICKVCGCKNGKCSCETVAEEPEKKSKEDDEE